MTHTKEFHSDQDIYYCWRTPLDVHICVPLTRGSSKHEFTPNPTGTAVKNTTCDVRQGVSWNLHNWTNWANGVYFTLGAASQRALESLQFAALTFASDLIDGRRDWQPQHLAATSIQPRLQTESPITAKLSWTAIAVVTAAADAQRVLLKINGEMLRFVLPTLPNFQVAKPQCRSDQTRGIFAAILHLLLCDHLHRDIRHNSTTDDGTLLN